MKHQTFSTKNDWTGLILRLTIGIVLFPHGAQKMLGWFDGYGFSETMGFFTEEAGLPWLVGFGVIAIEFVGSLSLIAGFASRVWALSIALLFTGILFMEHLQYGFFMNWLGDQEGEGYEYALLMIGLAIATLMNGSGKYAVDNMITDYRTSPSI